jgi:hypothetical protein
MEVAVKLNDCPAHKGPLLPAVGGDGILLILTVVDTEGDEHPLAVKVTEYDPAIRVVTFGLLGFCCVELKPLGPVHA